MNDHASRIKSVEVTAALLSDLGTIPNNPRLPLLLYKQAVDLPEEGAPELFEELFTANGWPAAWRNGIFEFHHYHSTAHEALGVYAGSATTLLGGEGGIEVTVERGDVVIIPAGLDPKSGSVRPKQPIFSAAASFGSHSRFCSSLPNA